MTFTWTSNLDGQIGTGPIITVNDDSGLILNDGEHLITLEVCDTSNNCASEQRGIELANQQPVVIIQLLKHKEMMVCQISNSTIKGNLSKGTEW